MLLGGLFATSTTIFGINPFLVAFFGALIVLKVPILPSLITSLVVCFIRGDSSLIIHFSLFTVLFAFFKSYTTNNDGKNIYIKYLLSNVISIVFSLVTGFASFDKFGHVIMLLILEILFFVIFKTGLKILFNIKESLLCSNEELIALFTIFITALSTFRNISFSGVTVTSLITTICIMLSSLKKPLNYGIANSLILTIIFGIVQKTNLAYFILHVVCSIIITLLSKAGKKGITIGFVFSLLMISIILQKEVNIPQKDNILENYNEYLMNRSGDYNIEGNIVDVPEFNQYTISGVISKQMAVGYLLLMLIPASFYVSYRKNSEESQEIQAFKEKMFNKRTNYMLNSGKIQRKKNKKDI